ncbi:putative serine protease K12H4.7 [Daktulosphaira vitifoliae]|uniref:putative serine protease K12H4.7 n=1 Tax=Daktulosphaira vitifoliae TaxID=58002 RepID=UPI0021A9C8B2|nr:putative serine protease K12H4.7 [Daktulosphaira vitifoliae]XP_050530555.1 putative serine protease K12H4.7 [Daktulosphaira vitifoliae]XP_050530556.1 putative serine protease K12H4.7 [Daktulosphaira vitifoliae]
MRFITFTFLCCVWLNVATQSRRFLIGLGEPNSPDINNAKHITDEWFEQKLDHFNPIDNRTWKQRYQINTEYYKEGGPIFLMIGGEGEISALWMTNGAWINYAKEFNALCIQLEHRFYGKSHPTDDMSSENLVYLSSEQALADIAQFIVDIKIQLNISASSKWIAFGGSYPGSLAAWLRMKYPHLVHAAVSSSGPLLAKLDFYEYFKVVEDALFGYKPECVTQIKNANQMLSKLVTSDKNTNYINKKFKLCDPLDISKKKDVSNLFETLAGNFAEVVQYNKDNRLSVTTERRKLTLETLCDIMIDESRHSPLDGYAAVNSKFLSVNNLSCTDYTYDNFIRNYRNVSWNSESAAGGRQWTYQTCTEFGFYQTSNQEEHVFGNKFPIDFFIDMCSDIYGKKYNAELLSKGIKRTNMMYGELNIKENRVIYVHGSVDPWHALGITETKIPNTAAIYINGTAHCANMYPPASTDLPQLTKARITIRAFLNEWLTTSDSLEIYESDNIHFY